MAKEKLTPRKVDLPAGAVDWLANGRRGTSSNTIFQVLTGVKTTDFMSHPLDSGDLSRCLALLEAVPDFAPRIQEMASVSREWAALVEIWDELTAMVVDCFARKLDYREVCKRMDAVLDAVRA